MSIETELKLALEPADTDAAAAFFTRLVGQPGQPVRLRNIYFDTPDETLAGARSALRLRETPEGWLQTLKSGGSAQQGLHRRHEWEMPVAGEALELDALLKICDDAQAASVLRATASSLQPIFRTDFVRQLWRFRDGSADIEIALDSGEVSAQCGGRRGVLAISEVELELKSASTSDASGAAALHALAARARAAIPRLQAADVSKAERGYRLRRQLCS
ncbi:MAG: CYTH domain-containing protein [Janthinobacterium lividum]